MTIRAAWATSDARRVNLQVGVISAEGLVRPEFPGDLWLRVPALVDLEVHDWPLLVDVLRAPELHEVIPSLDVSGDVPGRFI